MCHTHQPGDGIDRMEVRRGRPFYELVVQLASDDCTYVLPVNILGQLAGGFNQRNNPPALAFTTSEVIYETKCHVPHVAHDHHLADLHRLEVERVGNRLWFSTAVTACNCHVRFPVELTARLFMAAVTGDLANLTSHHHATNLPQGVRPDMDEAELEAYLQEQAFAEEALCFSTAPAGQKRQSAVAEGKTGMTFKGDTGDQPEPVKTGGQEH